MGVLENVLVKVNKFVIPVNFTILDMEEDVNILIIFGRLVLATVGIIIDVKDSKLKFQISEEEVEFNLYNMTKYPLFSDQVCFVDLVDYS